jgi:hypothetical protein
MVVYYMIFSGFSLQQQIFKMSAFFFDQTHYLYQHFPRAELTVSVCVFVCPQNGPPRTPDFNSALTPMGGGGDQMNDIVYECKVEKYVTSLNIYNKRIFHSRNNSILFTCSSLQNLTQHDVSFFILKDLRRNFL